jgi:tetratricopeptide (TPR) repeat protein
MDDSTLAQFETSLKAVAVDLPAAFFPDFRRLARGLQSDMQVWRLFLLKFEHRAGQTQVSSALRKLFGEISVVRAMAYADWIDLEAALREAASLGKPIELVDLDQWLEDYPDPAQADRRLGAWNIQRESCAQHVPVPLLCWLRPPRIAAFARRALDLWSWRHGVYDFSERDSAADAALPQMAALKPDVRRFDSRDEASKRARIAEIKQYLASEGDAAGERLQVSLLSELANLHQRLGEWNEALRIHRDLTLPGYQQLGDKANEAVTLNDLSASYHAQGDYETALAYLKQALTIQQQIGDKAGEGATLNNIALIYNAQGTYDTALGYFNQALTIAQQSGDKLGEAATLNNISQIHDAKGEYEAALAYLKQALVIQQQIGNKAGEGVTLNNIAQILIVLGDYDTALSYLEPALAIQQQIGDKAGVGVTLNNVSGIHHAQGDYGTALVYLAQSLAILQQIGDKAGFCTTLFNMGHIQRKNGQMPEAVNTWLRAYSIAKQVNLATILSALALLAPQLGMPEGLDGWEQLAQQGQDGAVASKTSK